MSSTHGHDLAFVMKGMCQDVVEDKRGSSKCNISIWKMQLGTAVDGLVRQTRQITVSLAAALLLQESSVCDCRIIRCLAINITETLKSMNPKALTVEDMNHLLP